MLELIHSYAYALEVRNTFLIGPTEALVGDSTSSGTAKSSYSCIYSEFSSNQLIYTKPRTYVATVFHTEGGVPWDFPSLTRISPLKLTDSTVYFVLVSHPIGIRSSIYLSQISDSV